MLYISFQVLDYGLLIRLDDGRLLVRQLVKVLQVLLALRGSRKSAYVDGIIMQLLVLLYQHNKSLPMWTMLVNNANVYNEEAGEQAFSVLSRCVLGDTQTIVSLITLTVCTLCYTATWLRTRTAARVTWRTELLGGSLTTWIALKSQELKLFWSTF